jgi:dipeptidyl aminopeptidase/acylaminoacyl peptidase
MVPVGRLSVLLGLAAVLGLVLGSEFEGALATTPGLNGKIAFASNRDGDWAIYVMDADGANQTKLTTHPGDETQPSWSPDGSKIAYVSEADGPLDIFVMNEDGSGQTNITQDAEDDGGPAWSPDGSKIAFHHRVPSTPQLYDIVVMNVDGTSRSSIAPHVYDDVAPAWSPDGSKITFGSNRGGNLDNYDLYIVNSTGGVPTNLTPNSPMSREIASSWSPDGQRLVFVAQEGPYRLYTMRPDGSEKTDISLDLLPWHQSPSWSPDGLKILFVSGSDPGALNTDIYVMDADGANRMAVMNSPADDIQAEWQPAAPFVRFDQDEDGCSDKQELGVHPELGGMRDRSNFWDFYDTPDASNMRDRVITTTGDILSVARRFGANDAGGAAPINRNSDPLAGPPPPIPGYHPAFDRSAAPMGADPWDMGPPDGTITAVVDILGAAMQFSHSCL